MARRRLSGDLAVAGIYEGAASDAALVLSELISNALRHATPLPGFTLRASWRLLDDSVEIAVSDGGAETVPTVREPAGWAIGGRGLGIVDRLSLRWGVSDEVGKTTVWALLPVPQDSSKRLVAGSSVSAG
jgi:anti-sigma regulatory factor (Ser/Thr protein kinase)